MRIGIVSGTPQVAAALARAIKQLTPHRLSWTAPTAGEAIARCATERPQLILLDLQTTNGDSAPITRQIMAACPCPILIVTDNVRAHASQVFEAMGHGALDAVDVPALASLNDVTAAPLIRKIATLSRLIGHDADIASRAGVAAPPATFPLVAIGASAGGPAALALLLRHLPRHFAAPIVIVQHVDEQFAAGMAAWLTRESAITVVVAREGDRPTPGRALMAGTGEHLTLKGAGYLGYTPEPRQSIYRPSVDVFFQSVTRIWRGPVVGVLLTGMGRDGAMGLKSLRAHGHHTIAQDEGTSAVYGMPKAAMDIGAASEALPTEQIASRLAELLCVSSR
jgi:two-component system, chemotaxis family, response regulator WspF